MIALDLHLPTRVDEAAQLAVTAEKIGFGCGWVAETTSDPFPVASAALLATKSMRVGTAVAVAFARSPFVTAQSSWEMARFSRGRFTLGLGTQVKGHIERRFSAQWSEPAARMTEYIAAVKACWRAFSGTDDLNFEGRFYSLNLLTDHFNPGPIDFPDIPIAIAGVNAGMARLAGQQCDGLICHPMMSELYLKTIIGPAVEEGASAAGRSRSDIELLVPLWVVTGDANERDQSRELIKRQIALYGSTRTYRRVFEVHGWDDVPSILHDRLGVGDVEAAAAVVTDEMVETFAVCAPLDQLGSAITERLGGLASRCIIYPPVPPSIDGSISTELIKSLMTEPRNND